MSQIFNAAQALSTVPAAQNLSVEQYQQAWVRALGGGTPSPIVPVDLHRDPIRPPSAVSVNGAVTGVTALAPTTDAAQKWSFTTSGPVGAGAALFRVTFATSYRFRDVSGNLLSFSPPVLALDVAAYGVQQISSADFVVFSRGGISAAGTYAVDVVVLSGVKTE